MNTISRYSPLDILQMSPGKLRKELTRLCTLESWTSAALESLTGFTPHWSKMTACQYAQIALAWAYYENHEPKLDKILMHTIENLDYTKRR